MSIFEQVAQQSQELGVFDFLIPFALTFAVVFGVLRQTTIFGDDEKANQINSIVALSVALFVAFGSSSGLVSNFLGTFLPGMFVIVFGIFGILLAAGMVFGEEITNPKDTKIAYVIGGVSGLAIISLLFDTVFVDIVGISDLSTEINNLMGIVVVVAILGMVAWTAGFIGEE